MRMKKTCARITLFAALMAGVHGGVASADTAADKNARKSALERKTRAEQLVALTGDEDYADEQAAWDKTYARVGYVFGKEPAEFLAKHIDELPKGRSLDIAMGEGRNTVYLAKKGFISEGVDISPVGLAKAQKLAAENRVKIITLNADLNKYHIKPDHYDVIINFYYLQRSLIPEIKAGLKKGGMVVFETHTMEQLKNAKNGGWERDFLLEPGELKRQFADFEILHYSETNDGKNAIASLLARKR